MSRFGLTSYGSYQSVSPIFDAEDCINLFPEAIESQQGKSAMGLVSTPGTTIFGGPVAAAVWGQKWVPSKGRHFAVLGEPGAAYLYEFFNAGTYVQRGAVALPTSPVQMICNQTQLLICSAGQLYVFVFATNVLTPLNGVGGNPASPFPFVATVGFSDGFAVAVQSAPADIALSAIGDFTSWNAINTSSISLFPDNIVSMLVDHRQLALFGQTKSVIYANAGAAIFPFQPVPGGYIEQGANSPSAQVQLDNSVFWLSFDDRGSLVAYRNGVSGPYVGTRISNHAVESQWQKYAVTSDAIGYSLQVNGHPWWHIYFPTAQVAWRYDVATGMWHKALYWNGKTFQAHLSQNHSFAFGKHLVGDYSSGNLYQLAMPVSNGAGGWNFVGDNGKAIRRIRRAPYVQTESQRMFHNRVQFDVQVGLGPVPPLLDGQNNPRDPQMILRWSDDGARTWSNDHFLNCGQAGKYKTRVFKERLGSTLHGRVYEIEMSDPVPWYISDGWLDATGFAPQQRLVDRIKQVS
jgi:hypothetical protein